MKDIEKRILGISGEKGSPPKWLTDDQRSHWVVSPSWRKNFKSAQAQIIRSVVIQFVAISIMAIVVSFLVAYAISTEPFLFVLLPQSIIPIANISCVVSASIIAIILAFLIFQFGHARNLEEGSRSQIPHVVNDLEVIRTKIADFAASSVREAAAQYGLKEKAEDLVAAAKGFDDALREFTRRFAFTKEAGTRFDSVLLEGLSTCLFERSGDWFKAYLYFQESPAISDLGCREYARRIRNDSDYAAKQLIALNRNLEISEDSRNMALNLSLRFPLLLFTFILGLFGILFANELMAMGSGGRFFSDWMSISLFLLLSINLILLVFGVLRMLVRDAAINRANRDFYMDYAEKHAKISKDEALKASLDFIMQHPDMKKATEGNEQTIDS